jgi:hypothetical protein
MKTYEALVQALLLSVTAPTEEKSKECLKIAIGIASRLSSDEVEKAKLEAEKSLKEYNL